MNYKEYLKVFEGILTSSNPSAPYNNPEYVDYTRLNLSRMNRWMKTMQLNKKLVDMLKGNNERQHWIIITEPWCGDAAHILPFLSRLAEVNPLITYDLQLRDTAPFLIESYLTNGIKSIPRLIIRNEPGNDLFTWGARPDGAQQLMESLKASNTDFDTIKIQLQNWYNHDKGASLQQELIEAFNRTSKQPTILVE